MKKIILLGGGGHCKSVIDVIEEEGKYQIIGILDTPEMIGKKILGYKVIGNDTDIDKFVGLCSFAIVTVGQIYSPKIREKLFELALKSGFRLPSIVSPRAYVSKHSKIGEGTVIMHDATVNSGVIIGKNCIVNSKALIEHDCNVANHCHISTGVIINGEVVVKDRCFIGSNSVTNNSITITEGSFIKAGSFVK